MPDPEDPKTPPAGDPEPKPTKDKDSDSLEEWKKRSRHYEREAEKYKTEATSNADAAAKLKQLEDSQKTELQKLLDDKETTAKELATARQELWRTQVAIENEIPLPLAHRLHGNTREEIEADAKELYQSLGLDKAEDADKNLSRRPQERLRPGSTPNKDPLPDVNAMIDKAMANSL